MAVTLSIVVPCHNEEKVLPLLIDRVRSAAAGWDVDYELVCVDDGSSDATWSIIEQAGAADPRVRGVCLSRNFGQQAAVSAGMHYAGGQALVVIDADLQDPPEAIPELVRSWRSGFKVVHAVRSQRKDRLMKRVLASGFYAVLASMAPFRIPRNAGEFVLLDRQVVDIINAMPEQDRYLRGLRAWCGFPQSEVLYKRDARAAGRPQVHVLEIARPGHRRCRLLLDGAAPARDLSWSGQRRARASRGGCCRRREASDRFLARARAWRRRGPRRDVARPDRPGSRWSATGLPRDHRRVSRPGLDAGQKPAALDRQQDRRVVRESRGRQGGDQSTRR